MRAALIEGLRIDAGPDTEEGGVPLSKVAQIGVKDPTTLVLTVLEPSV